MEKQVQQHEDDVQKQIPEHEDEQKQVQEHEDDKKQVHIDVQEQVQGHEDEEVQHTEPKPKPNPPRNMHSPPPEPEPHHSPPLGSSTSSDSPPHNMQSPPLEPEPHHSPPPGSSPSSDSPMHKTEEEEHGHYNIQPPFKPPSAPAAVTTKARPTAPQVDEQRGPGSSGRRNLRPSLSILKRSKRENLVKKALLGFRVCGFVFSLVSFSVLATDKDRGWAIDSFYRYKEFRYSLAVNVIAFVYSGFQAFDVAYQLTTRNRRARNHLRCYFDFSVDQMLTYLLMSASSSAAVRIDDWESNWGNDEFPDMAKASVVLSFIAFLSVGLSSLISGYTLCSLESL